MNGLSSDVGWEEPAERALWERARASAVLGASGLAWAALCAASGLAAPLCLAFRARERASARLGRVSGEQR